LEFFFSCGKTKEPCPKQCAGKLSRHQYSDPNYSALRALLGAMLIYKRLWSCRVLLYHRKLVELLLLTGAAAISPKKSALLALMTRGLTLVDACSGSKFSLEDGTPVKAPANRALRSYQVIKPISLFKLLISKWKPIK
jgi:hypothetical protein